MRLLRKPQEPKAWTKKVKCGYCKARMEVNENDFKRDKYGHIEVRPGVFAPMTFIECTCCAFPIALWYNDLPMHVKLGRRTINCD